MWIPGIDQSLTVKEIACIQDALSVLEDELPTYIDEPALLAIRMKLNILREEAKDNGRLE